MDALIVGLIAVIALVLFATRLVPVDVTGMGVLVALVLTGILSPGAAFAGFSDPAILTVAAVFLLSAGLSATGAVTGVGAWLLKVTDQHPRLLLPLLMLTITGTSAFINNTAAMAILMPVALTVARRREISPSRLLMPLSFASEWGGVMTLIGTSANLVVHSFLRNNGMEGLSMFELTPLGLALSVVGITYMSLVGYRLIPARRDPKELGAAVNSGGYLSELVVTESSPLVGSTLEEAELGARFHLRVLGVFRGKRRILAGPAVDLRAGDVLLVRGDIEELLHSVGFKGLHLNPSHKLADEELTGSDLILVEVMVAPQSWLAGRTIKEVDFRWRYRAIVVAIQRRGELIHRKLADVPLRLGDTLLLQVQRRDIDRLRRERNFTVLGPAVQQPYRREKVWLAVGIMLMVVLLNAFDILPIEISALLGVGVMVVTRCLPYEDMYRSVDWTVILLLGGMFSLGRAFVDTGLAQSLADLTVELLEAWGPVVVLAGFYVLTAVLTQVMSNSGSALIMGPIALTAAQQLGVDPRPFLIVVAVAASADFLTPVGYQTNTMIYGPGAYRFFDYTRAGFPLTLLFFVVTIALVPLLWPF